MKVFENLPIEINTALLTNSDGSYGNDCYVKWYVMEEYPERACYDSDEEFNEEVTLYKDSNAYTVHKWLLDNGCEIGEKVILEHSW